MDGDSCVGSGTSDEGRAGGTSLPQRKRLPHEVPWWVEEEAIYFVTICALPRNVNQLCQPDLALRLWESVTYREALGQWWVPVFLLMPDHLHMLVSAAPEPGLSRSVAAWKRYTARQFGIQWQRDFFEHRLRREESFDEKAEYIRQNPVRAGMVTRPEDWPYGWWKGQGDKG